MAANPITYQEVEAFERKALVSFTAWEADLIMRLDDAVLGAWSEAKPGRTDSGGASDAIPASNPRGVRALFQGIAAARKAKASE